MALGPVLPLSGPFLRAARFLASCADVRGALVSHGAHPLWLLAPPSGESASTVVVSHLFGWLVGQGSELIPLQRTPWMAGSRWSSRHGCGGSARSGLLRSCGSFIPPTLAITPRALFLCPLAPPETPLPPPSQIVWGETGFPFPSPSSAGDRLRNLRRVAAWETEALAGWIDEQSDLNSSSKCADCATPWAKSSSPPRLVSIPCAMFTSSLWLRSTP
jgi:hypothetical protein